MKLTYLVGGGTLMVVLINALFMLIKGQVQAAAWLWVFILIVAAMILVAVSHRSHGTPLS